MISIVVFADDGKDLEIYVVTNKDITVDVDFGYFTYLNNKIPNTDFHSVSFYNHDTGDWDIDIWPTYPYLHRGTRPDRRRRLDAGRGRGTLYRNERARALDLGLAGARLCKASASRVAGLRAKPQRLPPNLRLS